MPPVAPKTNPKSKSSTSSKKRKSTEVVELELANLDPVEAVSRVVDHVSKSFEDLKSQIEEAEKREMAFKEKEDLLEKLTMDLTFQVKKMTKEKKETELTHAKEIDEVILDAKNSAKAVVMEAQIQMAAEVGTEKQGGWDLNAWKATLAQIVGDEVSPSQEPGPAEEEEKREGEVEMSVGDQAVA